MELLVSQHHEYQRRIARDVVAALHPLWDILDFHELRKSTPAWLKATRPIVEQGYLQSRYAAAEFVKNYRNATLPDAETLNTGISPPWEAQTPKNISLTIMVSLRVTGPVWLAQNTSTGMNWPQVKDLIDRGFSKSSGAATRLVLNGGRAVVRDLVRADPLAQGVAGIAAEGSCKSCQALTSPIWKWEGTQKMDAVAVGHDFCTCSAKPLY